MATRRMEMAVLIGVIVVAFWGGARAQSNCQNVLISLSPCLDYITGNSSSPSSGCCTQLASVVKSQPRCLCDVISGGGSSSLGININQTQALALPSACNVQTPPASRCGGASPTASPGGKSSPSESGSKTTPSTSGAGGGGDSSDGNLAKLSFSSLFFILLIASCASILTAI